MPAERVTVTLSPELVRDIDRHEPNRSRFIQDAVRHEIDRRRREELRRSLRNPHPETQELADLGFDEWAARLPDEDVSELVDPDAGQEVRWTPGQAQAGMTAPLPHPTTRLI